MIPPEDIPFVWAFLAIWVSLWVSYFAMRITFGITDYLYNKRYMAERCAEIDATWKRFYEMIERDDPPTVYMPYTGYYIVRKQK